jgi:hypothetical protein
MNFGFSRDAWANRGRVHAMGKASTVLPVLARLLVLPPICVCAPQASRAEPAVIAVTMDGIVEIDNGRVSRSIAHTPISSSAPTLVADGARVVVLEPGSSNVLEVDLASGQTRRFATFCCLTGSGVVRNRHLYVMVEDRGTRTLEVIDLQSGDAVGLIELPDSVLAVTVVDRSPGISMTPTPTPTASPRPTTPHEGATATLPLGRTPTASGCHLRQGDRATEVAFAWWALLLARRKSTGGTTTRRDP